MTNTAPRKGRPELRWLEQSAAKQRGTRQAHSRREIALDLLVGIPITMGMVRLFLAYFGAA